MRVLLLSILLMFAFSSFAQVSKKKDIIYKTSSKSERHQLDVYYPKNTNEKKDVILYFHGGSWKGGKKDTYKFLGKRFAKKGFVVVIANYRLSPEVKYQAMAEDCAAAFTWVYDYIEKFGGDKNKITVSGHSAGAHLAAFISFNDQFKDIQSKIRKTILIDPFGLDMFTYFNEYTNDYADGLKKNTFTNNPEEWKAASPLYSIKPGLKIPVLVLVGGKTFPTILQSTAIFNDHMTQAGNESTLITIEGKKHIGMVTQLFFKRNDTYAIMINFIQSDSTGK